MSYLTFNNLSETYDLSKTAGFFLPSGMDRGGVATITAAAYTNADGEETVKWKPFRISVLDAPDISDEKFLNPPNLLGALQNDLQALDEAVIKKTDVEYIPQTFEYQFSDEGERVLKVYGVSFGDGSFNGVSLASNAVDEHTNGDMTPGMLSRLNNALLKSDLSDGVIQNAYLDIQENEIALKFSKKYYDGNTFQGNDLSVKIPVRIYRHRVKLSGQNSSLPNAFTLALKDVYTKSAEPITTVSAFAAALGVTSNAELVPVSGCAENGTGHTVLCTEAWVGPSSITLHGMYFGYSSGNGIIERVVTTVTSVSDVVTLVE